MLAQSDYQGITISESFPQYWQYKGKPLVLLGGSDEDNLFQMKGVEGQLDELKEMGGNYVRCTMSSRDEGNQWPFFFDEKKQRYDLKRWNENYWHLFENFLARCHANDIIVQIEIWATFDFYRNFWQLNPFNPKNNSTYGKERTHLKDSVNTHPIYAENPFFWSIPSQRHSTQLLGFQQRFVDKILSYTFKYDNVLYCMDNETSVTSDWGKFWATYIKKRAQEEAEIAHCTEMWDPWDLNHISHRESFDHPEIYSFVEISQNNHQKGEAHWNNGLKQIQRLRQSNYLRPVNNIKIYGADGGQHGGGDQDGIEKFCRNIFFGAASSRFHRPTSGLGFSAKAKPIIKSMRQLTDVADFFKMTPLDLLKDREENEAYCRGIKGKEYLIYFTNGGEVALPETGSWQLRYINFSTAEWNPKSEQLVKNGILKIACPEKGNWGVHLIRMD